MPGGFSIASASERYSALSAETLDTPALADGLYDLRAVAVDNAGNSAAATPIPNVRIDNTAPRTTDDAPSDVQAGGVTVTLSATFASFLAPPIFFNVAGDQNDGAAPFRGLDK